MQRQGEASASTWKEHKIKSLSSAAVFQMAQAAPAAGGHLAKASPQGVGQSVS